VPIAAAEDRDDEGGERGARSTRILGDASLAVHALLALTVCLAMWTGVREVRAGELAPGELFLFIAYALMVHRRLVDAGRQLARVGKVRASVERLAPLLDAAGRDEEGRSRPLQTGVRIEGLRVEAIKGRRPRLDDLDLEVPAGSRVAVIGRPGAGKSTLLRSLAGVEPAAQGTLRWDGEELTGLDALLRTSIGFLPHDPVFPPAPAWHILGLSGPDALESKQIEMLRDVGAWKIIEKLPRGLRQKVSSATVSRNEARALALGAVLLGDAPLVVLDAPVEGLKKRTAVKRLQAVARAVAGRTLVIALPRLAGAAGLFDRVVVLRRGRVVFAGSPENWRAWIATRRRKEVAACRA
jgi:ATP-binding cassette subfamily B protein